MKIFITLFGGALVATVMLVSVLCYNARMPVARDEYAAVYFYRTQSSTGVGNFRFAAQKLNAEAWLTIRASAEDDWDKNHPTDKLIRPAVVLNVIRLEK